ncbi:kinase-like domain-containing protein [Rhizophagus irregularis DAOM 181602=DAOM 197198]|uniref:Kinase-like domain-containing protein n=1 Tax=Rhizophagus irregularis (strain DAOM 181602 / DAOM 197198 / MUCL 43194) TaxID=747089 RepID=A0A2P4P0E1_RHIID|nr:kinase-like domain-containing protein [Rhizophagus irregularis DAOM 181602=DAOM 197198]POG58843.1 kinase-like domain-containing protein [Rhizophagus irregularis DAOM 181602=DAOM 197198]|eukprot:XP_025165709.1 kinase-like domain-containing protein [Rhizophagus irregularis DAOM 181602=DAOM 197198]
MEPVNTIDENSFDPTPRLKSSPIPIKFISFNEGDENCICCGEKYIQPLLIDLECSDHEINKTKVPQSIQECCGDLKILSFKQILDDHSTFGSKYDKVYKSEKYCKLCGKSLLHRETYITKELIFCSDCYLIFTERIESSLVKKEISIFYIPRWHTAYKCDACYSTLIFTSDCQKYCSNCYIFYVGCRYCLTTNIIFGPTGQTQCKKCKRISFISCLDDSLLNNIILCDNLAKFENIVNKLDKYYMHVDILDALFGKNIIIPIRWIPYSQFKDVKEMTKGGYGIIYKATWLSNNETVILKRFENSKNNNKYFLNELKSSQHCYSRNFHNHIIKIYGFTKDPELGDYVLVMKYATEGDLHKYLQKEFTNITWNYQKLRILWQISEGLEHIHKNKFIHRDFHSGNMLFDLNISAGKNYQWKIGDLGLSQEINNESSNNEIYGIIP